MEVAKDPRLGGRDAVQSLCPHGQRPEAHLDVAGREACREPGPAGEAAVQEILLAKAMKWRRNKKLKGSLGEAHHGSQFDPGAAVLRESATESHAEQLWSAGFRCGSHGLGRHGHLLPR